MRDNINIYKSTSDPAVVEEIVSDMKRLREFSRYQHLDYMERLKAVEKCPYCGSTVHVVENSNFYSYDYGSRGVVYVCRNYPKCDSYVGSYVGSVVPVGTLANSSLRRQRKQVQSMIKILQGQGIPWDEIKEVLSLGIEMPVYEVGCGMFTDSMCRKAFVVLEHMIIKTKDFSGIVELSMGDRII